MRYHISKVTGVGACKAKKGNCPFGGKSNHFGSREEAEENFQIALEKEFDKLPIIEQPISKMEVLEYVEDPKMSSDDYRKLMSAEIAKRKYKKLNSK